MKLPKSLQKVVEGFERLPGIGPKTAQRLAFYMLRMPKDYVKSFSGAMVDVLDNVVLCEHCFNVTDEKVCEICQDKTRDNGIVCVVETPLDVLAIEKAGYKGLYHVTHGVINPLAGIRADDLYISPLFKRLVEDNGIKEVIIAVSTSLEGETTAMYIRKEIDKLKEGGKVSNLKVTRIGRGLPVGADIEYADGRTINDALSGRVEI